MKRLIFAIITLLIICSLCILNIPKYTLTTTLGSSGNTNIETTKITTKVKKKKSNNKKENVSNEPKISNNEILNYLQEKVKSKNWSESDYKAIIKIINRESGFKVEAVNKKSGACGLFQAYPCSKMKKYGSDYKTNYKTQIAFGIDYIASRYGTPTKALEHQNKKGWY